MAGHRPPSRLRYERNNPTVSIRLTKEIRDILDKVKKEKGLSYPAILKDAFKKCAAAYQNGFAAGRKMYEVTYPCNVCGQPLTIQPGSECHKAVLECLRSRGWGHTACHEKARG